tara:strand:- start:392 stop:493 length:102 start_codon:yes stop_codon:yes gene_type:complete
MVISTGLSNEKRRLKDIEDRRGQVTVIALPSLS